MSINPYQILKIDPSAKIEDIKNTAKQYKNFINEICNQKK